MERKVGASSRELVAGSTPTKKRVCGCGTAFLAGNDMARARGARRRSGSSLGAGRGLAPAPEVNVSFSMDQKGVQAAESAWGWWDGEGHQSIGGGISCMRCSRQTLARYRGTSPVMSLHPSNLSTPGSLIRFHGGTGLPNVGWGALPHQTWEAWDESAGNTDRPVNATNRLPGNGMI